MSDTDLDDFLADFDFGGTDPLSPTTAEEFVLTRLTEGKNPRIEIIKYNLKRNYEFRDELRAKGITFRREVFEDSKIIHKELTNLEYARAINEEYINSTCGTTIQFAEQEGRGKVNMAKLLDLVNANERIKPIIEKA